MFVSRLAFHTLPGKTQMVEDKLQQLVRWVGQAGGQRARIMRTHYGSPGVPDLIFEQEVENPATLEEQIKNVTSPRRFSSLDRRSSSSVGAVVKARALRNCLEIVVRRVFVSPLTRSLLFSFHVTHRSFADVNRHVSDVHLPSRPRDRAKLPRN